MLDFQDEEQFLQIEDDTLKSWVILWGRWSVWISIFKVFLVQKFDKKIDVLKRDIAFEQNQRSMEEKKSSKEYSLLLKVKTFIIKTLSNLFITKNYLII